MTYWLIGTDEMCIHSLNMRYLMFLYFVLRCTICHKKSYGGNSYVSEKKCSKSQPHLLEWYNVLEVLNADEMCYFYSLHDNTSTFTIQQCLREKSK